MRDVVLIDLLFRNHAAVITVVLFSRSHRHIKTLKELFWWYNGFQWIVETHPILPTLRSVIGSQNDKAHNFRPWTEKRSIIQQSIHDHCMIPWITEVAFHGDVPEKNGKNLKCRGYQEMRNKDTTNKLKSNELYLSSFTYSPLSSWSTLLFVVNCSLKQTEDRLEASWWWQPNALSAAV